jgi:pimeloyl-ACP methyl ester carboxylesterase
VSDNSKKAILHVHGSCGNFYENMFLDNMARDYCNAGVTFLSMNTRGHDYIADLKIGKDDEYTWMTAGGYYDIFDDSLLDIQAGMDFLTNLGYTEIILQGHSLGAVKVCYAALEGLCRQIILMAPPDVIAIQKAHLGNRFDKVLLLALERKSSGKGMSLMPKNVYEHRISANSYISLFNYGSMASVFQYSEESDLGSIYVSNDNIKCIALIGNNDEYLVVPIEKVDKWFRKCFTNIEIEIIPDCGHSFQGCEQILVDRILGWIEQNH